MCEVVSWGMTMFARFGVTGRVAHVPTSCIRAAVWFPDARQYHSVKSSYLYSVVLRLPGVFPKVLPESFPESSSSPKYPSESSPESSPDSSSESSPQSTSESSEE